ncbi:MAG: TolC family protein [Gemmatimonadaceae bacterium]|jgi:cobalt-zinc-cadmium efflux system outer membrane protein|nr:TolC family protein [Gemmatimonadaceae bacterium]
MRPSLSRAVVSSIIASVAAAASARAQAPLPPHPTLDDLLVRAASASPALLLARLATDSAGGELRIAQARPNPQFQAIQNTPYQYGIFLQLEGGPARSARIAAARAALAATRGDSADAARVVRALVRQGWYDLLLAEAQRDLAARTREIYRQLLQGDSVRLRAGDVAERNVVKGQLELSRAEATLAQAAAGARGARVLLQSLVGITAPDTGFTVAGALDFRTAPAPLDSALPLALATRPDAQAAGARITQGAELRRQASRLWIPLPQVSLVGQHNARAFEPDVPWTVGNGRIAAGLALPLPLLYRYRGEVERATAGAEAAQVNAIRTRIAIAGEVTGAIDAYRATRAIAERYEGGLLRQAETALDQARYAYRGGAISLLDLLDAIRTYEDTYGDRLQALHDYWIAVTAVNRAIGRDLLPQ